MKCLVLDTDPGQDVDDTLAILCLLSRVEQVQKRGEDIRVKIITSNEVDQKRAAFVNWLIQFFPDVKNVEIYSGVKVFDREPNDIDFFSCLDDYSLACKDGKFSGIDDFIDSVQQLDCEEITYCCIAPMGNLAEFIHKNDERLLKKINLVCMGGTMQPGNFGEHNVNQNSLAANVVFNNIGKFAAHQIILSEAVADNPLLAITRDNARKKEIIECLNNLNLKKCLSGMFDSHLDTFLDALKEFGFDSAKFFDPVTVMSFLEPGSFKFEECKCFVEKNGHIEKLEQTKEGDQGQLTLFLCSEISDEAATKFLQWMRELFPARTCAVSSVASQIIFHSQPQVLPQKGRQCQQSIGGGVSCTVMPSI